MKNILKSLFVAVALVFGVNVHADNITATLTHTASSYTGSDANTWTSTVDAEKEHINNQKTSGAWNGFAYADFSYALPEGHSIKSATLAWSGVGSGKNRNTDVLYVNAGEQLDYTALAAGNAKVSLGATKIASVTLIANTTTDFTTDVTEAVKTIYSAGQGNIIFKFTNNSGGGDLVGKGAAEKYPVLTIETVSAADMTTYTVVALDAENNTIKTAVYDGVIGETATASAEDMSAFKNEDASKKYIYVGGNSEITLAKDSAANIINLTFREAETYRYSIVAVNAEGELMQTLTSGSDFEGETLYVPYCKYILNYADSTLYEAAGSGDKGLEFRKTLTLSEDGASINVTYNKSSINNVIYFAEAEDTWGMTTTTAGNALVRSSNAAGGYPAEGDVELTGLSTGKYKLTVGFANFKSSSAASYQFALEEDVLFALASTGINLTTVTSDEFTVLGSDVPFKVLQGGNDNQALDFFYIQKTGVIPATEVANIAALKDVQEGMEVKLALTDAVVNLWSGTGQSMASYVEDATGAIKFDTSLSNMEWMNDSIKMNGYVYATYGKDYDGIPQLSVSDSTGASKVDTVAAVPASKVMTVADASTETALSRYVKFEKVEFVKKVVDDWGTTECYLVQGTDTIVFFDKFYIFGYGSMPDFKSFDEVQGIVSMYDGKFEFYPYGEYKANYTPAVVAENIAAAKAVENGTNVNLTLKDAKVTAYVASRWGAATAYIEDASGAIQIAGDVLSQFGVENDSTILNGNIYVKYVNEWGSIQLSAGDSLAYSNVEAKEGAVSPTTMAVKDIKDSANVSRYVEVTFPSFKYDEENYCYIAVQNGDTIKVVDNFGWMSQNFEMDEEYNLVIPDSVSSIRGIVMWDDWNGYSISPTGIDEYVAPQDIVVNVAEGDIAAAVEAAKAEVAKVGKITVNLTEGVTYTVANSIVAPAALVINGNGATVDATALGANFIESAVASEVITVDSIAVLNVTVKGLGKALYYSAGKNIGISNFVVDNSVIEIAKDVTVFDFTKGSAAMNFAVKNSTIYAPTATTKSIYSSQGGEKGDAYGATADAPQTFIFENTTLYNLTYNKNFFSHRQNGQKWLKYVVKNNVIVNSGKANFMTSINGGPDSKNPQYEVTTNSVGSLVDGVYTDLSASQTVQSNVMGTLVTTAPGFKDVANGDFTVGAGSDQAKEKIGDPRWLVEYDNTATAIEGVNATIMNNGDIFTINGVKVRNAGDSLKGLAKGLYIINGKKLIVK